MITIIGIEDGEEREGTILHIVKLRGENKWFIYDECLEGIQADGDGTLIIANNEDEARKIAEEEARRYQETYKEIYGEARILHR